MLTWPQHAQHTYPPSGGVSGTFSTLPAAARRQGLKRGKGDGTERKGDPRNISPHVSLSLSFSFQKRTKVGEAAKFAAWGGGGAQLLVEGKTLKNFGLLLPR